MSEPTPPDSRSLSPGARASASERLLVELRSCSVPTATALKADLLMRPTPLPRTTTSSSRVASGRSAMSSRRCSPAAS